MIFGCLDHRSAYGVSFNISIHSKKILFCAYEARFETAFPKWAGASMPTVKRRDIVLSKLAHRIRQSARPCSANEQVDMIAHKNVGMYSHIVITCTFGKKHQIMLTVVVIDKNGAAIYAALSDMLGDVR